MNTMGQLARWSVLLPFFSVACQGQAEAGRAQAGSSPSASATQGSPGTGGAGGVVIPTSGTGGEVRIAPPLDGACTTAVDPGRVTLRRLGRSEYDNTVADLLADTTRPGQGFPNDDAFLADALTVGPLLFEKYDTAAEQLVAQAWAREVAGTQPAPARLWVCAPSEGNADCARQIVTAFARRAFRRPATDAELAPFTAILGRTEGSLAERTQAVLHAVLLSPNFAFRVEIDPDPLSLTPHGLTLHELATRLSYTVWGSMPDATLFTQAESGALAAAGGIASELSRMMASPKARALTDNFAMRWLTLDGVSVLTRDTNLYPEATATLFSAMQSESQQFLNVFFGGTEPVKNLMTADFTFANQLLAQNYGLDATGLGSDLVRVAVPAGARRGLLGQGAVLSVSSHSNKASAVRRGKWVASRLLCTPPPNPPPGITEKPDALAAKTERERLAIHRADPVCASCHSFIDPIGLGLENFDAIGRFRAEENGVALDVSGQLPGGQAFNGPVELSTLLAADPRFHACASDQLATYALGRALTTPDQCLKDAMSASIASGASVPQLLEVLVTSSAFTARHGEAQGATP